MTFYMNSEDGQAVGTPIDRPAQVRIASGHVVGCAHWTDTELAELAGVLPVVNGYDPSRHVATGGGELVEGGVAAAYGERPIAELQQEAIDTLKAECSRRILAAWPDYKQRSAALGVYGADAAAACKDWISRHVAVCADAEAAIMACVNLVALDKLPPPNWPA